MSELLAKSAPTGQSARTLVGHTDDVITAFDALFSGEASLLQEWLRFFRLPPDAVEQFLRLGRLAAFCHDWGKANDGFQNMLTQKGRQTLRHEVLSAVILVQPSVWRWMSSAGDDLAIILAAVVCHHLKAKDEDAIRQIELGSTGNVKLLWNDNRYRRSLGVTAQKFGLTGEVPTDVPTKWSFSPTAGQSNLLHAMDEIGNLLAELDEAVVEDEPRRRLLWAVRAALICADSAGSGLYRNEQSISDWIRDAFFSSRANTNDTADGRLTKEMIDQKVVVPRLKVAGITAMNEFQIACGDPKRVPARALLLAPCGSGKTLAAWNWVAARCAERPCRRAIFLYPTRGTATEGFRDYLLAAGVDESALVHGAADLDLDGILSDAADDNRLAERRLFALRQWPYRLLSATADQFLGFLQHGYGPTCHLPLLADSVVVCDEVHSYDRGLFSALMDFLKHFDVPVLAMTATMLENRRQKLLVGGPLKDHGLTPINGLEVASEQSNLKDAAEHKRYLIRQVDGQPAAALIVRKALKDKKRVLWVVNTVDRCQAIARDFAQSIEAPSLQTDTGQPLYCYHSRFRLVDRQQWHAAVVKAFKPAGNPNGVLAVTTQVCEMSLDLDADFVITELCPATALVQRMGRCCRDAKAYLKNRAGDIVVYAPKDESGKAQSAPYSSDDLNGVGELVAKMTISSPVSQAWLEAELLAIPEPPSLPKASRFVESGPWAASDEEKLRDGEEFARPALVCQDLDGFGNDVTRYQKLRRDQSASAKPWQAEGLVVPVPKSRKGVSHAQPDISLPSWLSLAINGVYFKTIGFDCDAQQPALLIC